MAEKTTFAMDEVETIDLTEPTEKTEKPAEGKEVKPEEPKEPEPGGKEGEPEGLTSFADAFKKALEDQPETSPEDPKEPKAEDPKEPEAEDPKESRSASDFKQVKTDRDNARRELDELKGKLSELENADVDGVMDALKTERDDLSQRLQLAAIERHPKFQKEFQDKVNSISEHAKRVVGAENADRVAELIQMNESDYRATALEEVMVELSTTKQAQLGSLLTRMDEIKMDRTNALENAESTYQTMMADQTKAHEAQVAETHKLFDEVLVDASNLDVFANREGDDEWNNEVKHRVDMARDIFSGDNDPSELARASLWAAAAPKYRELLVAQMELNRRLRKELTDEGAANPSVSSGGGESKSEPTDFVSAFNQAMGN